MTESSKKELHDNLMTLLETLYTQTVTALEQAESTFPEGITDAQKADVMNMVIQSAFEQQKKMVEDTMSVASNKMKDKDYMDKVVTEVTRGTANK